MASGQDAIPKLFEDSRSLWVSENVCEYNDAGDAITFLRNHVAQSIPCVWRGAARRWQAVQSWPKDHFRYLREKVGTNLVEVAVTPDGLADAVLEVDTPTGQRKKVFAMPHQVRQPFEQLINDLVDVPVCHPSLEHGEQVVVNGARSWVPYYSAQDGSLTREVPELLDDVDQSTIQFAKDAFGSDESAVNIWVGDGRSVTTMHADPFENMYAVVAGVKIFEVRPPCDAAFLPKPSLDRIRWVPVENEEERGRCAVKPKRAYEGWRAVEEAGRTDWIDENSVAKRWGKSMEIILRAGDILYLPGLWCKLGIGD